MFCSLLVFWLIVADTFLVTLISASLLELFGLSDPNAVATATEQSEQQQRQVNNCVSFMPYL